MDWAASFFSSLPLYPFRLFMYFVSLFRSCRAELTSREKLCQLCPRRRWNAVTSPRLARDTRRAGAGAGAAGHVLSSLRIDSAVDCRSGEIPRQSGDNETKRKTLGECDVFSELAARFPVGWGAERDTQPTCLYLYMNISPP